MNSDEIRTAYIDWYKKKTGRKVLKHDPPYMFTTAYTIGSESRQPEIDKQAERIAELEDELQAYEKGSDFAHQHRRQKLSKANRTKHRLIRRLILVT